MQEESETNYKQEIREHFICNSDDCKFCIVLKIAVIHGSLWQYADDVFATKRELIESLMNKGDKEEQQ